MCKLVGSKRKVVGLCNEFGFAMLNSFSFGSKRFVLVLTHSLLVKIDITPSSSYISLWKCYVNG